jgi:hypothetical protein
MTTPEEAGYDTKKPASVQRLAGLAFDWLASKYHHHRFLSGEVGNSHLETPVAVVTAPMKVSPNWTTFLKLRLTQAHAQA